MKETRKKRKISRMSQALGVVFLIAVFSLIIGAYQASQYDAILWEHNIGLKNGQVEELNIFGYLPILSPLKITNAGVLKYQASDYGGAGALVWEGLQVKNTYTATPWVVRVDGFIRPSPECRLEEFSRVMSTNPIQIQQGATVVISPFKIPLSGYAAVPVQVKAESYWRNPMLQSELMFHYDDSTGEMKDPRTGLTCAGMIDPSKCTPTCAEGYVCELGKCIKPCNPPCTGGKVCRDGACIAEYEEIYTMAVVTIPRNQYMVGENIDVAIEVFDTQGNYVPASVKYFIYLDSELVKEGALTKGLGSGVIKVPRDYLQPNEPRKKGVLKVVTNDTIYESGKKVYKGAEASVNIEVKSESAGVSFWDTPYMNALARWVGFPDGQALKYFLQSSIVLIGIVVVLGIFLVKRVKNYFAEASAA